MFVCYLDDSDAEQSAILTLAGYVAPLSSWEAFEAEADPIFANYGVPILHAKEFHDTKDAFKGWSGVKKNSFVDELYAVARRSVSFGISRSIHKKTYKERQFETGLNKSMSAYGVLFSAIMVAVSRQNSLAKLVQEQGLSFIVESGHNNNEEIEQYFHRFKNWEMFDGVVRSLSFSGKAESRAIQLADFYAFYSRREAARSARFDNKLALPRERIFERFRKTLPHHEFVAKDPYVSQLDDWHDLEFNGDTRANRPFPSERPVGAKRR